MIRFKTSRFGELEVAEDRIITFPEGLPGFINLKRFVLLDYKDTDIKWLQAVDSPDVAFIVIDPFTIEPNYEFQVPETARKLIGLEDPANAAVLVILRTEGEKVIANMQGPLVINSANMLGVQLILESTEPRVYNKN